MASKAGRAKWLPKDYPGVKGHSNTNIMTDGEPISVYLTKYTNDSCLHAQHWQHCCDCGLRHLITYEVYRDRVGRYFLNTRAYRDDGHWKGKKRGRK